MPQEKKYYIKCRLAAFVDKHAVLETEDRQRINWPIKNLPDDIRQGDDFRLVVSSSMTEDEEIKKTAKEIINQILND
ncbi:MAG: DUF3006 family protein [Parcubacteria group bacterium]|nr:MAG: DUF3006 family protein [Parcubacteria group bacterium]